MAFDSKRKHHTHASKLGEHPLGETIGAAVGASAGMVAVGVAEGAALGAVAGPVGIAAGVLIGGAVGILAGKETAELFNPNAEDNYWRHSYKDRPYVSPLASYSDYEPAYHHGIRAYSTFSGRKFEDMEPYVAMEWENARGDSPLRWDEAEPAVRDAYERLYKRDNPLP